MWKEDFRATVTDKRLTKQGIWIALWIGLDKSRSRELTQAFHRLKSGIKSAPDFQSRALFSIWLKFINR